MNRFAFALAAGCIVHTCAAQPCPTCGQPLGDAFADVVAHRKAEVASLKKDVTAATKAAASLCWKDRRYRLTGDDGGIETFSVGNVPTLSAATRAMFDVRVRSSPGYPVREPDLAGGRNAFRMIESCRRDLDRVGTVVVPVGQRCAAAAAKAADDRRRGPKAS